MKLVRDAQPVFQTPAEIGQKSPPVRRQRTDRLAGRLFFILSVIPVVWAIVIAGMLVTKSWPLLSTHSSWQLLSSPVWKPEEGLFGFRPFIAGTIWVTITALLLAVPPSLLTAIYISEYSGRFLRKIVKPLLDLLAAIPSVILGVWGTLTVVPLIQNRMIPFIKQHLENFPLLDSKNQTGFGILAGAIVLAIMIMPLIIAVVFEILDNFPKGLKEASLAVGTTKLQTIRWVILPKAIPGIIAAIVFGASRAVGETMAVLMVVGNVAQVPHSLLDAAYPLPALIANNYGEMMSIPAYDSALMTAALILLIIILTFNIASALILQLVLGRKWV
jgi:phosphate transport system permease protein